MLYKKRNEAKLSKELFRSPTAEYRGTPFWSWNTTLEKDELLWIAEKEAAIEEAAKYWEGGSGEAMVRNVTASDYTKDRCYYLISIVKGEKLPE